MFIHIQRAKPDIWQVSLIRTFGIGIAVFVFLFNLFLDENWVIKVLDGLLIISGINFEYCSVKIDIFESKDVFIVVRIRACFHHLFIEIIFLFFVFSLNYVFVLLKFCNILKFLFMLYIVMNSYFLKFDTLYIWNNLCMGWLKLLFITRHFHRRYKGVEIGKLFIKEINLFFCVRKEWSFNAKRFAKVCCKC